MKSWLLVDKYAPETIEDCILPSIIKDAFQGFVDTKNVPNLLLSGPAGMGKTTTIRCLAKQLDADFVIINGSKERSIDNVRTSIIQYGSSMSLNGNKKILLIDEADGLTVDAQNALRGVIEEFQNNCTFVFTCNTKSKIIGAIRDSRMANIDFFIPKNEKKELCLQLLERLKFIMCEEGIEYEEMQLAQLIKAYFPDIRRILNELQKCSSNAQKKLILSIKSNDYSKLVTVLKAKDFTKLRRWISENFEYGQFGELLQDLWENVDKYVDPTEVPSFIILADEYQDKFSRAISHEVHCTAFLLQMMTQVKFK